MEIKRREREEGRRTGGKPAELASLAQFSWFHWFPLAFEQAYFVVFFTSHVLV